MTKAFAESYINKRPKSRNAQLFLLDLTEKQILKGESKPTDLVDECKKYFDLNGHKTYAFPDLRKYLANFDYSLIKEFQTYITERTSNKVVQFFVAFAKLLMISRLNVPLMMLRP